MSLLRLPGAINVDFSLQNDCAAAAGVLSSHRLSGRTTKERSGGGGDGSHAPFYRIIFCSVLYCALCRSVLVLPHLPLLLRDTLTDASTFCPVSFDRSRLVEQPPVFTRGLKSEAAEAP